MERNVSEEFDGSYLTSLMLKLSVGLIHGNFRCALVVFRCLFAHVVCE